MQRWPVVCDRGILHVGWLEGWHQQFDPLCEGLEFNGARSSSSFRVKLVGWNVKGAASREPSAEVNYAAGAQTKAAAFVGWASLSHPLHPLPSLSRRMSRAAQRA